MLQAVLKFSQLAESDPRAEETPRREQLHAALIAAIVCRIWQDRNRIGPSVRQQLPRFSNITETKAWHDFRFRAEEFPRLLRAQRIPRRVVFRNGSTFYGETVLLLIFSVARARGCSACNTCNEVVPAHMEFFRAKQTPVPLFLYPVWCLYVPCTRYQVCCTWNERLEARVRTSTRTILLYVCYNRRVAAHPHSLLNFVYL